MQQPPQQQQRRKQMCQASPEQRLRRLPRQQTVHQQQHRATLSSQQRMRTVQGKAPVQRRPVSQLLQAVGRRRAEVPVQQQLLQQVKRLPAAAGMFLRSKALQRLPRHLSSPQQVCQLSLLHVRNAPVLSGLSVSLEEASGLCIGAPGCLAALPPPDCAQDQPRRCRRTAMLTARGALQMPCGAA